MTGISNKKGKFSFKNSPLFKIFYIYTPQFDRWFEPDRSFAFFALIPSVLNILHLFWYYMCIIWFSTRKWHNHCTLSQVGYTTSIIVIQASRWLWLQVFYIKKGTFHSRICHYLLFSIYIWKVVILIHGECTDRYL